MIKQHMKALGTFATGQGDDYITGCLLEYAYVRNDCKMI